ncbi:MAG TPA: GAF domain-containing protein [Dongiaceae bacterium]|nr:GAF domain-containing protein [Dongiaceae bacterium]
MKLEAFSKLTVSLYEAALEPERWQSLATEAARTFGVESCLMQVQNRAAGTATLLGFTSNLTAKAMAAYRDHFYAQDWWATTALTAGLGNAVICGDFTTDSELVGTEFYADWLAPHDIYDALAGTIRLPTGDVGIVGIHRARRMRPFGRDDQRLMRMVMTHYAGAVDLSRRLATLRRGQSLAFDAMDALSAGMLIVDRAARVVIANRTAEAVLRKSDGLGAQGGVLAAHDGAINQLLHKAIRDALLAARGKAPTAPAMVVVPREAGPPLSLMVCPLPADATAPGSSEPMAMIFLGDPDPAADRWSEALARAYHLTPAESRLAAALLRGERPQHYCERAGITINTAKSQIRSILAKSGCARQSEFVRQVFSDPVLRMAAKSAD